MKKKLNKEISIAELLPVFDGINDAVFIDDNKGICIWCNPACEEMYKVSLDEIAGRSVMALEKEGIFTPSVTMRVLEQKREVTIIHENRLGKRLLTTGTPLFKPGSNSEISLVITSSRDITQITSISKKPENASLPLLNVHDSDSQGNSSFSDDGMVVRSDAMLNVMSLAKKLAKVNSTVLITGESGVGKSLIAKTLHKEGNRSKGPLITVNCGAIPESLIESELFGYVAGAFTGSRAGGKTGFFEAAKGGTIFLDEISELPLNLQVKLLQVIQDREITPVGSIKSIPVDVRIISATNRDLDQLVQKGEFREDLYYRLNVVPINVPPLRERTDDIIPLLQSFLKECNQQFEEHKSFSPSALSILVKYPWPGNIRELQNIVERLVITSNKDIITESDIFQFIKEGAEGNTTSSATMTLAEALENAEKEILSKALGTYKSTRAIAKVLHVSQPTIVRKLNKYGLKSEN